MTFPTDDIQEGPRSWGRRPSTEGVILHTTEYAGPTRASAETCARDQAKRTPDRGWAQPGSYNFIVYDGGVLLTVPYLEASGGINPASAAWAPERYPWLRAMLGAAAYGDPTMHHLQIAFSGKAAQLAAGKYPANMIDSAARLLVWAEDADWADDNLVVSGHCHWQTNRSDPGAGVIDMVLLRYAQLRVPAPPPPVATPAGIDHASSRSAFGTLYPDYVHSDAQALAWTNRNIARLRAAGRF